MHAPLAVRAPAGLNVEAGDDGPHWREIGLILRVDGPILERSLAVGALGQGHGHGLIDVVGRRPVRGRMTGGSPRWLGLFHALAAAKGRGLTLLGTLEFVELAAESQQLLLQVGDLSLEGRDAVIARLAARA